MSSIIFYFFSHIQTYLATTKQRLNTPGWIKKLKYRWMAFHMVFANIGLVTRIAAQRVYLTGLMHYFVAFQLLVLGPVLVFISSKVSKQLFEMYSKCVRLFGLGSLLCVFPLVIERVKCV